MPNDTIPASAPALPSRRFFLGRATAGLAGGLVAAAAVAQPSLAALPSAAAPESDDPIFALIEEHARAHEFSNARDTANDDAEETDRRTGIADTCCWSWSRRNRPASPALRGYWTTFGPTTSITAIANTTNTLWPRSPPSSRRWPDASRAGRAELAPRFYEMELLLPQLLPRASLSTFKAGQSRHQVFDIVGSPSRTRTCDHSINSRMLYQLSYRGSGRSRAYSTNSRPEKRFNPGALEHVEERVA